MSLNIEQLAQASRKLTIQRFGRTVKIYAPLYLSNRCQNSCPYCNFNIDRNVKRTTLSTDEILKEAKFLSDEGHRSILLVAGDDPAIDSSFLADIIDKLKKYFSEISIEVAPLAKNDYKRLCSAGLDGVTLYQETYGRKTFKRLHGSGSKDYDKRLESIEAAAQERVKIINIGALLGLSDWREEIISLFEHARRLIKDHWQSSIAISFPRLKHVPENFKIPCPVSDIDLVQMICKTRREFPDSDLVLSTRESPKLRDHLIKIGITKISAGSCTSPGGYTTNKKYEKQFEIEDARSANDIILKIKTMGYDVVWKN